MGIQTPVKWLPPLNSRRKIALAGSGFFLTVATVIIVAVALTSDSSTADARETKFSGSDAKFSGSDAKFSGSDAKFSGSGTFMWSLTANSADASDDDAVLIEKVQSTVRTQWPTYPRPSVILTRWEPSDSDRQLLDDSTTSTPQVTLLLFLRDLSAEQTADLDEWLHEPASLSTVLPSVTVTSLPPVPAGPRLAGYVHGLASGHQVKAELATPESTVNSHVDTSGVFAFARDDTPDNQYQLGVSFEPLYYKEPQRKVTLDSSNSNDTRIVLLRVRAITPREDGSTFVWKDDGTLGGHVVTSGSSLNLDARLTKFHNVSLADPSDPSPRRLRAIKDTAQLTNGTDGKFMKWTSDYALRLFQTLEKIPKRGHLVRLKWYLTSEHVQDDIEFDDNTVILSVHVFKYAKPLVQGRPSQSFFSKRLHMACVRFVVNNVIMTYEYETDEARRLDHLAHLLRERFGVEVAPRSIDYQTLTRGTTGNAQDGGEDKHKFQSFHASELLSIVAMFEEMPDGLHKLKNLKVLLRRKTAQPHPLYPTAAAVAWPHEGANYIEFMDKAFINNLADTFRLVLHEKGHFLYADSNIFPQNLKAAWQKIGGWSKLSDDTWTTSEELTFVSPYAHLKNPNEDFAESLAAYIRQPKHLQSRAPKKYKFLHDHILKGVRYETRHRQDLTFEVFNLWPDRDAPGQIDQIKIDVDGEPADDKTVHITITLKNDSTKNDAAKRIHLRLKHSTEPVEKQMYLYPTTDNADASRSKPSQSHELSGKVHLSKYAPQGDWTTDQIIVTDAVGNERYVRITNYGWECHVINPLEDRTPPLYQLGTLRDSRENLSGGVQQLTITWSVTETFMKTAQNVQSDVCLVKLLPPNHQGTQFYALEKRGTTHKRNDNTFQCAVNFIIQPFFKSGVYEIGTLVMENLAGYTTVQTFHPTDTRSRQGEQQEPAKRISISTVSPDNEPPEISLNSIQISATSTNPNQPNGETIVTISIQLRDPQESHGGRPSGVSTISYALIDPSDRHHHGFFKHNNTHTLTFQGEPRTWTTYEKKHVLPVGSQPGTWALHRIQIYDKARNVRECMFTEIVQSSSSSERMHAEGGKKVDTIGAQRFTVARRD